MDLKETAKQIYENNKAKGFWDKERNVGEMLMLVTSELAEALEADRKGYRTDIASHDKEYLEKSDDDTFKMLFELHIKNTYEDEIADAIIRLLDISFGQKIAIAWHIQQKMRYNSMRPHMHGKKY